MSRTYQPIVRIKEPNFLVEELLDTIVVTGSNFELNQIINDISLGKNLILRANELSITYNYSNPGRNLFIACKKLIAENIEINVSGSEGEFIQQINKNGSSPGDNGDNGDDGKKGKNSGNVTISFETKEIDSLTIKANGGNGSPGQKGGNGQKGANGAVGNDLAKQREEGKYWGPKGGKGGTGGAAGPGGNGGPGGNSGLVEIYSIYGEDSDIKIIANAGIGGLAGANGQPGDGGNGGIGGRGQKCSETQNRLGSKVSCSFAEELRGPYGDSGNKGANVLDGKSPKKGRNGEVFQPIRSKINYRKHSSFKNITWIYLQLHQIELDYNNNLLNIVTENLRYLHKVSTNFKEYFLIDHKSTLPVSGILIDQNNDILMKIRILIIQIYNGLDYWGHYPNYVPLTSVAVYESILNDLFEIGEKIEKEYDDFFAEEQVAIEQRNIINRVILTYSNQANTFNDQIDDLREELNTTRGEIEDLLSQILALKLQLEKAELKFRDAVSKLGKCDFYDILNTVMTITSGIGALSGGIAAVTQFKDIMKEEGMKETFEKEAKFIVKEVKYAKGGLEDIKNGYQSIKEELEGDNAKLILDQANFEKTIADFEDLDEAIIYRDLMRSYININKIRNEKILHSDAILIRIYEIQLELNIVKSESNAASNSLIKYANPKSAEHIVFLERALTKIKLNILRALNMQNKSLSYWSLKPYKVNELISDKRINFLQTLNANFKNKHGKLIENRNGAPNKFTTPIEILFNRHKHKNMFAALDETGKIVFNVSEDLGVFADLAEVLVNSMDVRVDSLDYNNSQYFKCVLTHHGNPIMVDRYGNTVEFRHKMRKRFEFFKNGNNVARVELGGNNETYYYLSPFAQWTLQITDDQNNIPSKELINEIGISFTGTAYQRF